MDFLTKENETDKEGRIVFIGEKTNEESDKVLKNNRIITPIYNDSDDLNGDIFNNMYIPSNESKMCDKIADLFSKAALEQYDCYNFAKIVMTQTDLIDTNKLIDVDSIFDKIIQKFHIQKKKVRFITKALCGLQDICINAIE